MAADAERQRRHLHALTEENASLQEAVELVAAAQKEVTVRRARRARACAPAKRAPQNGVWRCAPCAAAAP